MSDRLIVGGNRYCSIDDRSTMTDDEWISFLKERGISPSSYWMHRDPQTPIRQFEDDDVVITSTGGANSRKIHYPDPESSPLDPEPLCNSRKWVGSKWRMKKYAMLRNRKTCGHCVNEDPDIGPDGEATAWHVVAGKYDGDDTPVRIDVSRNESNAEQVRSKAEETGPPQAPETVWMYELDVRKVSSDWVVVVCDRCGKDLILDDAVYGPKFRPLHESCVGESNGRTVDLESMFRDPTGDT